MIRALRSLFSVNENEIQPLNGIRAFAILFVMLYHFDGAVKIMETFSGMNWIISSIQENLNSGVDLFFILSGFLITRELHANLSKRKRYFTQFYIKRVFRILPAYYLLIIVSTLVMMMKLSALKAMPPTEAIMENIRFVELHINSVVHDALFVSNIFKGGVPHSWALSLLMQFYLFFPPLAYFFYFKKGPATRIALLAVSYITITCARLALADAGTVFNTDYFRFDSVLIGIFLFEAFSLYDKSFTRLRGWRGNLLMALGLAVLIVSHLNQHLFSGTSIIHAKYNLFALGYGLVILPVLTGDSIVGKFFSMRPFIPFSRVSYTMFLWHLITPMVTIGFFKMKGVEMTYGRFYGIFLIYVAGTFIISVALYLLAEYPFHRLKESIIIRSGKQPSTPG